MLSLAIPVIIAELGWITMGIVDTVMVRRLGPAAIGAVGTGSTIFMALMVLGMGTLFALDTFVSQNFGAGRIAECHRWLWAGLQLSGVLSALLVVIALLCLVLLPRVGLHPDVLALLQPYLFQLLWSAPPLLVYTVLRRYLQSMNVVRPVMVALVTANVINAAANWILINGRMGFPAFGVVGSAYATVAARVYMACFLLAVVWVSERRRPSGLHDIRLIVEGERMWQLVRLGLPAAIQIGLEVGVFAAASTLAGRLTPLALAANQIALNVVSFFFMIPLGLNSAAAVRVGHAHGRRDPHGIRTAGWTAIVLSLGYAVVMSAAFVGWPVAFLRVFTDDVSVLRVGASLLMICALFQPFDGLQVVCTGALRGLGETRIPMLLNLAGHWAIGLPLGYVLCFRRGWGVEGLWAGLALGLMLIGAGLVWVWQARSGVLDGEGFPL
jgi:MATE family multidrug resistance protein